MLAATMPMILTTMISAGELRDAKSVRLASALLVAQLDQITRGNLGPEDNSTDF